MTDSVYFENDTCYNIDDKNDNIMTDASKD